MLRARLLDPAGPRRWRAVTTLGLLPLVPIGLLLPLDAVSRVVLMLAGLSWLVLGRIVVPRLRARDCEVELGPTWIQLHRAGAATQRIDARQVHAASTARLEGSCSLGVVRYGAGDPPLWLDLESAGDVERVRRALGVAHAGFGEIAWPPRRGTFHSLMTPFDLVALFGWLATIVLTLAHAWQLALTVGVLFAPATLAALLQATGGRTPTAVSLSPQGLRLFTGRMLALPWSDVVDARATTRGLLVRTQAGDHAVKMPYASPVEREHFAAQIRSAAMRARGEGPPPPGIPASVAVLAPGDEPARTWLERVDATAASLAGPGGYRQGAVEQGDLWTALESTDVPAPLRAAAARILARVAPEQAGPRIAQVLAQEHDAAARDRIRVALEEDVDVAARNLDALTRTD